MGEFFTEYKEVLLVKDKTYIFLEMFKGIHGLNRVNL